MSVAGGSSEQQPLLAENDQETQDYAAIERQADEQNDQHEGEDDPPLAEEPSTRELAISLCSIWVGVFLNALGMSSPRTCPAAQDADTHPIDSTVIATLSGPISASFKSFTLLSWLVSAYLIANAALQPLTGRLTDIFSRRTGLLFSNVFFAAGNLICGLAKSESVMILGRVVAGMGGGGLNAIATFVASDLVPLRRRGVWQGFGNIAFGLGSSLGGVFGGLMNDVLDWRWAFLIQVPFVVFSGILVFFVIKIPVKETDTNNIKRVDFLGAFTLTATLVLLLGGLNSGGNIVPWDHPLILTSLPLSAVFLAAFIYVEDQIASEPIISVRLLLHRTVLASCLTNWFGSMAAYSLLYYGPIYFQIRGLSATASGARLIPHAIGLSVGSLGTGLVVRWTGRYYWLNLGVEASFVLACALIAATFNLDTPSWPPFLYFLLGGFGYGGMLTVTLLALIGAVDHKYQAVITSASYAFRSTGSTIGITIVGTVFQNILKTQLWKRFGDRKNAAEIISRIRDSIEEIKYLPPEWKHGVLETYMDALRGVWFATLGMATLAMLLSLFMREHTMHSNLARK